MSGNKEWFETQMALVLEDRAMGGLHWQRPPPHRGPLTTVEEMRREERRRSQRAIQKVQTDSN